MMPWPMLRGAGIACSALVYAGRTACAAAAAADLVVIGLPMKGTLACARAGPDRLARGLDVPFMVATAP
jgi:hypothetical protein